MCANVLGSFERIGLALETSKEKLFSEWFQRKQSRWPTPKNVPEGVCNEVTVKEENVDLYRYPALKWNLRDGGRYITLGVLISKDPETGQKNAGIYRLAVQGKQQLGVNMMPERHVTAHYAKAEAKGKPLEVAVAIGLDPTVVLAAATDLQLGEDELAFAGALRGGPVKVTNCKTVDLEVPASAEIVIEGVIPPKVRVLEGPFGESNGYYGKALLQPVLQVKCITHREKPIYQATYSGRAPQEEHFITAFNRVFPNGSSEDSFSRKISFSTLAFSAYGKLKTHLTSKPVKPPGDDMYKVAQNWTSYGLE
jgi:4-hydroxy-3-polyprenylbenzoate decarboxylase